MIKKLLKLFTEPEPELPASLYLPWTLDRIAVGGGASGFVVRDNTGATVCQFRTTYDWYEFNDPFFPEAQLKAHFLVQTVNEKYRKSKKL